MTSNVRQRLAEAMAGLQAGRDALDRVATTIEQALQAHVQAGVNALPEPTAPISEHRRAHRPGRPPRIANDPELQVFIAARVDRLTFTQIADDIAQHFPASRRVGKTTIHDWWRKARNPNKQSGG